MTELRTYYNVELPKETAGRFKEYCRDMHLKYEASECFNLIHFEVNCNENELKEANAFLNTL